VERVLWRVIVRKETSLNEGASNWTSIEDGEVSLELQKDDCGCTPLEMLVVGLAHAFVRDNLLTGTGSCSSPCALRQD